MKQLPLSNQTDEVSTGQVGYPLRLAQHSAHLCFFIFLWKFLNQGRASHQDSSGAPVPPKGFTGFCKQRHSQQQVLPSSVGLWREQGSR